MSSQNDGAVEEVSVRERVQSHLDSSVPHYTVSSWTRFTLPLSQSLDWEKIRGHLAHQDNHCSACIGRIEESRSECVLVICWSSYDRCKWFLDSARWRSILDHMREATSNEPETKIIQFLGQEFWYHLNQYVEVRTAYFPMTISADQMWAIWSYRGFPGPYLPVANSRVGFALESTEYHGEEVLACTWIHYWADPLREYKHKFVDTATVRKEGIDIVVSAEEGFLNALDAFGALGWSLYHIDFDSWSTSLI